jgi:hypothetical protein
MVEMKAALIERTRDDRMKKEKRLAEREMAKLNEQ